MSVPVRCPHCRTTCRVAEQYLGVPVKCGRCGRSFTAPAAASPQPVRLDIAVAFGERLLAQHLVYWNLDARHELAVFVSAGDGGRDAAAAALAPLLSNFLSGASQDAAGAAASIAAACKDPSAILAVIWDGHVAIGGAGVCPLYHHSGGRLTRLPRDPVKLRAGDWLVLAGNDPHSSLDESALQREMAASPSAAALTEHLAQAGSGAILAVRCY